MITEQERKVCVWNTVHAITILRQSPTAWVAVGEYMGQRLEVKEPTQGTAVRLWIRVARYKTTLSDPHVARVLFAYGAPRPSNGSPPQLSTP
jgi:hypothetical protein